MSLGEFFTIYVVSVAFSAAPNGAGRCVQDPKVECRLPDNGETKRQFDQVNLFTGHGDTQVPLSAKPQHGACRRVVVSANII